MRTSSPRFLWFNYERHLPRLGAIKVPLIILPDVAFDVFIDRTHSRKGEGVMYHIKGRKHHNN